MKRTFCLATLLLASCNSGPVVPEEPETVSIIELPVGGEGKIGDLDLKLTLGPRITRRDGQHLQVYTLSVGLTEIEGDSDLFVDEAVESGKLVTVLGWDGAQALSLRVDPAPSSPALEEDDAGELGAAEALRQGFDTDASETSYELTRGEGAVVYLVEDGDRVLCRIVVGLHSGTVIASEAE